MPPRRMPTPLRRTAAPRTNSGHRITKCRHRRRNVPGNHTAVQRTPFTLSASAGESDRDCQWVPKQRAIYPGAARSSAHAAGAVRAFSLRGNDRARGLDLPPPLLCVKTVAVAPARANRATAQANRHRALEPASPVPNPLRLHVCLFKVKATSRSGARPKYSA